MIKVKIEHIEKALSEVRARGKGPVTSETLNTPSLFTN